MTVTTTRWVRIFGVKITYWKRTVRRRSTFIEGGSL